MATENALHGKFEVEIIKKTVVKAKGPLPESRIISLSNLDLLSGRFPVTYIYFYKSPSSSIGTSNKTLESSLAQCLEHFYPFAGSISQNPKSNELEIICDNSGVLVIQAQANISLKEFDFYNLNKSLQGKLVFYTDNQFLVQVQIINYTCGGISVTFTFDHALGDASAFSKFLITWSEIAMKKKVSCSPDHSRNLRARDPPSYDSFFDEAFISCTMEEIGTMPTATISTWLKRLYYIDESSVNKLQGLACANGGNRTKIEAFSAYIWKIMANAIDQNHKHCKIGVFVDGRTRFSENHNSMANYIGNVLSLAFGETDVTNLKQGSVADISDIVHKAIFKSANEAHFRDLIDWIECHKPGLMLPKTVLGLDGPAIAISSRRRFPVAELDFGFGSPILGTVCSTIERPRVGYINQRPSARGDGSWIVSAILWPEMVEALESDPDRVFQPMNVNFIQL
ncbi:hypothetical protein BUALT_Bualt05G0033100 [Buddleja alternifolia]|uniref:Uncharacterized protein n=1 Tax=Buddleja alternifolia TaxID=168488 RepID=A0AAV6XN70_9LAMI|nr:hypothetical protein BUALT_Bualt05G0033100 [Buddleja alternifolia]